MAKKDLEICHLDRGLMEAFTDSKVEQNECMDRGGNVCHFKLKSNEDRLKRRSP
jgi:predicted hydrocarbon binding protein